MELTSPLDEALRAFKEMRAWREASSSSCQLARSDFAFHFRDQIYLTSNEKMFDLSPTRNAKAGESIDGIRQFLMGCLPLRYVNKDAWIEKLTRSGGPGAQLDRAKSFSARTGTHQYRVRAPGLF